MVIFQTTFSNTFSWMEIYEFRWQFWWSLFLRVQLAIVQHLVHIMAWCKPDDKPLSEPMMVRISTNICVTCPQWVNKLRPQQIDYRFADDNLRCILLHENYRISIYIALKSIITNQNNNTSYLAQVNRGIEQATSQYTNHIASVGHSEWMCETMEVITYACPNPT